MEKQAHNEEQAPPIDKAQNKRFLMLSNLR